MNRLSLALQAVQRSAVGLDEGAGAGAQQPRTAPPARAGQGGVQGAEQAGEHGLAHLHQRDRVTERRARGTAHCGGRVRAERPGVICRSDDDAGEIRECAWISEHVLAARCSANGF